MAKKITRKQRIAISNLAKLTDVKNLIAENPDKFLLIKEDFSSIIVVDKVKTKKDFIFISVKTVRKELGL